MTSHALAAVFSSSLLIACTDGVTDPTPVPPDPIIPTNPNCAEDPSGATVVACNFGPGITPIAAGDGRVYTVSPGGTYSAIDLATATTTRLFRYTFSSTAHGLALGAVLHEDRVYFPGNLIIDEGVVTALMAIDTAAPTPDDDAEVIAWGDEYELVAPMVSDGTRLYAESIVHEDFSAFSGPVVSIGFDGEDLAVRTSEYGSPVGVAGGWLYYRHDRAIKRVSTTGGPVETLATALSTNGHRDQAVDDIAAYTTTEAAPYELRRFATGGASQLLATASSVLGGEIPVAAPRDLRRHGDWLYFLQDYGDGARYATLQRVRTDGTGAIEFVFAGDDLTVPVFDDTGIYVGYTRGGVEEPIEGAVLRITENPPI